MPTQRVPLPPITFSPGEIEVDYTVRLVDPGQQPGNPLAAPVVPQVQPAYPGPNRIITRNQGVFLVLLVILILLATLVFWRSPSTTVGPTTASPQGSVQESQPSSAPGLTPEQWREIIERFERIDKEMTNLEGRVPPASPLVPPPSPSRPPSVVRPSRPPAPPAVPPPSATVPTPPQSQNVPETKIPERSSKLAQLARSSVSSNCELIEDPVRREACVVFRYRVAP